jgi:hypothetical protein
VLGGFPDPHDVPLRHRLLQPRPHHPDGRVTGRVHEQSGWRQDTRKHGIEARFTADGDYAVLTPVFRTGTWRGRPRACFAWPGALLTPRPPRGLTNAEILDHHPHRGWWLRLGNTVTAVPDLVEQPHVDHADRTVR